VRITSTGASLAVELPPDRTSFGLSALGIALFRRASLPTTVTLVSFSSQKAGLSLLLYLSFAGIT